MRGAEAQFKALVAIRVFVQQEPKSVAGTRVVVIVSSMANLLSSRIKTSLESNKNGPTPEGRRPALN